MQNIYLARTKDNRLHCFYHTDASGISHRLYEDGKWGLSMNIMPDAREDYTVTLSSDGAFYVFCADGDGNIVLCTNAGEEGAWQTRTVLQHQAGTAQTSAILFHCLIASPNLRLIYNSPPQSKEEKTHALMIQQLTSNGEWGVSERLDRIMPLLNTLFYVQPVGYQNNHAVIFYQTKTPETNLGYREITGSQCGAFHSIHITGYQIADASFLTTTEAIHALFTVKTIFATQLVYKKKEGDSFTNPVVIWEGQRIESCLLQCVGHTLHASFISGGVLYTATSENSGQSFGRPVRYRDSFCQRPAKAFYLSALTEAEAGFDCRELYVDAKNPCDIQVLPRMIPDFYPAKPIPNPQAQAQTQAPQQPENPAPNRDKASQNPMPGPAYTYSDVYDPFANMNARFMPSPAKLPAQTPQRQSLSAYAGDPFAPPPDLAEFSQQPAQTQENYTEQAFMRRLNRMEDENQRLHAEISAVQAENKAMAQAQALQQQAQAQAQANTPVRAPLKDPKSLRVRQAFDRPIVRYISRSGNGTRPHTPGIDPESKQISPQTEERPATIMIASYDPPKEPTPMHDETPEQDENQGE